MRTYGGREAEGAQGGTFTIDVSEVVYWSQFQEESFWDAYMTDIEIVLDVKRGLDTSRCGV